MTLRRLAALVPVTLLTVALAACGRPDQVLEAETEGFYVDISELQYQVQSSRQLNPAAADDQPFLRGLSPQQRLEPGEVWFAIFLRATNPSSVPQPTVTDFTIVDSQENEFHPVPLGAENLHAWPLREPVMVPPGESFPPVGSPAEETPTGGALILFRIPVTSLANRPFELVLEGPLTDSVEAVISLDV